MKKAISETTRKNAKKAKKKYFIEEVNEKGKTMFRCYRKYDCSLVCEAPSTEMLFRQLVKDGYIAKDIDIIL